jgi:hypothetical protein
LKIFKTEVNNMKRNFKRTLSLILAVLMVMTVVPMSGMASEEVCTHENATIDTLSAVNGQPRHYVNTCPDCGLDKAENCFGPEATTCEEAPKCLVCEQVIGEALPHNYSERIEDDENCLVAEVNCKTFKQYYKSCSVCGEPSTAAEDIFTSTTKKGEHTPDAGVSNEDATCEEDGTLTIRCSLCSIVLDDDAADDESALGHNFTKEVESDDRKVVGSVATCAKGALYYLTCSRPGCDEWSTSAEDTFEGETSDDHDFKELPILVYRKSAATCSKPAEYYRWCPICEQTTKDLYGEDTDETFTYGEPHTPKNVVKAGAVGKNQEDFIRTPANCNNKARYNYLCAECEEPMKGDDKGFDWYEDGEPINPNHGKEYITVNGKKIKLLEFVSAKVPATCTTNGQEAVYKCLVETCPYYGKEVGGEVIEAPGHDFDATKAVAYLNADRCLKNGVYGRRYCKTCGYSFYYGEKVTIDKKEETVTFENLKNPEFDKKAELSIGNEKGEKTMVIEKANHTFVEDKDYCTVCGEEKSANNCSCIVCNGKGFMFIVGLILNFFWKLTGQNQYCAECQAQHW